MNKLLGKVVVVTGASSGIGAAAARRFAGLGATVIITARSRDKLDSLSAEYPDRLFALPLDVTDEQEVHNVFESLYASYGTIDVLVNNAGFGLFQTVTETPMSSFAEMMDVNYFGTVRCTKAVLPRMIARRSGHIVNVASVAGFIGTAKSAGYSATKHAVIGFTDALRHELYGSGVHAATVNPGPVDTPFFDRADPAGGYRSSVGKMMVTPEHIAKAIVDAVLHNRPETFVPGYMGWGASLVRFIPTAWFNRLAARFLNLK